MARIGVFICHCGTNIAGSVNIPEVLEAARRIPSVVFAADSRYSCSEPGQASIQEAIVQHHLNRVVVAACSPRMHEITFRKTVAAVGLNPYLLEIANIREQDSWVHSEDREAATDKAIELIKMAVAKVARAEPLYPRQITITKRALVVGGGITGIQAALDIANAGHEVVLVEREPSIGGHMAQLDKTFPTLDCSACILTPKMVELAQHPNITFLTYASVHKVSGFIGNFEVEILQKTRKVNHAKCNGCGICWQKCPEKTASEFDLGLAKRTAIYIPFPQAVPPKPVIDTKICRYIKYLDWVAKGKEGKKPPECRICEKLCPVSAIDWDEEDRIIIEKFGAIVVATGYDSFDPSSITHYSYGLQENVITSLEFERLANAAGPTGGKIVLKNGKEPDSIAIIHCVGSRDKNYHEYCSRVCCMYSMKFAHLVKERIPEAQVYEFYIDIRSWGKGFEEFYNRLSEEGVIFIRGKVAEVTDKAITEDEKGRLIVCGEDTLLGVTIRVPVDMVILSCALEPRKDAEEVARLLGLSRSPDGFFLEKHPKLEPVGTMSDGIFVAGACVEPLDIRGCVAQGSAAAAKVNTIFSKDTLATEPMVATVDSLICIGCLLCVQICPFKAISDQVIPGGRTIAVVNESLCKGCGLCIAACRPKALNLQGFTNQQILAEVMALWQ